MAAAAALGGRAVGGLSLVAGRLARRAAGRAHAGAAAAPGLRVFAGKGFGLRELASLKGGKPASAKGKRKKAKPAGMDDGQHHLPAVSVADLTGVPRPLAVQKYPHPCLRAPNATVGAFDDALRDLAKEMFALMYATDGIGLAAPQVGANVRVMVFNAEGVPGAGEEVVLVNPRIVKTSKSTDWFEEGCLSFPKMFADVLRPLTCVVEAKDLDGNDITLELDDLEARVFQHEFDHLDGTLFIDRMDAANKLKCKPSLARFVSEYEGEDAAL